MAGRFEPKTAVLVAVIIAPHGIAGNVSAECLSDNPRRFVAQAKFFDEQGNSYTLKSASVHKGRLLLGFSGINDRNAADKLRGTKLYINQDISDTLPEGEYYHYQLIGLEVREAGESLGKIADIMENTAHDIFVVRNDAGEEILIPALKEIVIHIDPDEGYMDVKLPQGLR